MNKVSHLPEYIPRRREVWTGWLSSTAFIPGCFIVGLGIRLLVILFLPVEQLSDSAWYVKRAIELTEGMGYQEGGHPTAFWPVGWPAILAGATLLFQSVSIAVSALNLAGAAGIMALMLWFGRRVIGNETVARLALLAYAVYPNHISYAGVAATETVYTALTMLAFAMLVGGRDKKFIVFISGLLFGVATMIKPQTIAFPFGVVIALVLVYRDFSWLRGVVAALIVYLSLLLIVLPWSARNVSVFDEFVLVSTNAGTALILGANDEMTGSDYPLRKSETYAELGLVWEERVERQAEYSRIQKEFALDWIGNNTLEYIAWMPKKVVFLWIKDTDGFWAYDHSYPDAGLVVKACQLINQIFYLAVLLLSLPAAFFALRALLQRSDAQMPLGLIFCFPVFLSLLAAIYTGQIRYHFPAMPSLILAAAWASVWLAGGRKPIGSTVDDQK